MADQPNQELPRAKRRRLIVRAVLRGLLVTTVLVALYYLLPLDRPLDTGTAIREGQPRERSGDALAPPGVPGGC